MKEKLYEEIENNDEKVKKIKKGKKNKPILTEQELKAKKVKKTRASVAAFVLLLGIGVMGNWYYENTDLSSKVEPLINSTQTKTLGEAEYVDSPTEISTESESSTESEYFSSARVDRQTARDESLDKLQSVVDNTDESEEAHKSAQEDISKISSYINIENKIETLVTAKGVKNCLAVVSDDGSRVDVIVDVEELSDSLILQIKEIAMEQLGCTFENVSIIQSN
jgi:stage III sporulation protein AH